MRVSLLIPAALLVAGCYRPSLPSGHYQCSADTDCPSGQECLAGLCYRPGEVDLAGTTPGPQDMDDADESVAIMPDMTVLDFRDPTVDLREADLTPVPCTGPGTALTSSVSACKGNFTNATQQRALCGLGYHICESRDVFALQAAALTGTCPTVGGFFAARIAAGNKMSTYSCPPAGGQTAMIIGCGSGEAGIVSFTNVNCYGMNAGFVCKALAGSEWTCTASGLDGATHTNGAGKGGLLCCRD